jgi:surface antigen
LAGDRFPRGSDSNVRFLAAGSFMPRDLRAESAVDWRSQIKDDLVLTLPSRHRLFGRHTLCALLSGTLLALLVALLGPGYSQADVSQPWVPSSGDFTKTARPCPSPAIAAADAASCWSVGLDQSNPLYSAGNPYPWGQCTYWALEMRPDLWNDRSPSDPAPEDWAAYTWGSHASLEDLAVDDVPAAGAMMVWPQAADDPTGHVAYVQDVSIEPSTGNELIVIQEFNNTTFDDPAEGQGDTMTLHMSPASLTRVRFIHEPGYTAAAALTTPAVGPTTATAPPSGVARATSTKAVVAVRASNPRLRLEVDRRGLLAETRSPAPLEATISALRSDHVIRKMRLHPGARSALHLLTPGRYRVCVFQPAAAGWKSAGSCRTAARTGRPAVAGRP